MTRVLIFGGRDWNDQAKVDEVLDHLHATHRFTEVINGGQATKDRARHVIFGADWQAAVWAKKNAIPVRYFYANWAHGKSAGPYRNERMLVVGQPQLGVQFPGGKGTRDMRRRLDNAGIPVIDATPTSTQSPRSHPDHPLRARHSPSPS